MKASNMFYNAIHPRLGSSFDICESEYKSQQPNYQLKLQVRTSNISKVPTSNNPCS